MNIHNLAGEALRARVEERLQHLCRKNAKVGEWVKATCPEVYSQYHDGLITMVELFQTTISFLPEKEASECIDLVDNCLASVKREVLAALREAYKDNALALASLHDNTLGAFLILSCAIQTLDTWP